MDALRASPKKGSNALKRLGVNVSEASCPLPPGRRRRRCAAAVPLFMPAFAAPLRRTCCPLERMYNGPVFVQCCHSLALL